MAFKNNDNGDSSFALDELSSSDRGKLAETAVLIPAAGRVPEGLLALSNIVCPAMVPVAGRPVIYWTMTYLRSLGLRRFFIAVSRRGMFIEDFVECAFGQECEVEFMVPASDGGVGSTVLELAERATGNAALVVLGDTHFQFASAKVLLAGEASVLVHPVEESYRWCTAQTDSSGLVTELHDKEPGLPGPLDALIGVYHFPQIDALRQAAATAVAASVAAVRKTEMADVLGEILSGRPIHALQAGDWLDCGNPDRRADSHRTLLQMRAFNELTIDSTFGTVTKRSRYVEKFLDEINYLRLLPPELSILFPRVVSFSTDWDDPWLTMEYYGYPTLAEVFVFENLDPGIWEHVFVHLRDIMLSGFMRERCPLAENVVAEMYLGKTCQRLQDITASAELLALIEHEGSLTINGQRVDNLPLLWDRLTAEVGRMAENVQGAVVHGDLCLSNILYDLRSRICKLLDPRGSFGVPGIYGDPRYDVAKLFHSIYGLYDFIINDLFHVTIHGTDVMLDIRGRQQHQEIQQRFERIFFSEFDRREILLITGLLFVSMTALHYEAPKRQIAMYVRGLQLLNEVFLPELTANQKA